MPHPERFAADLPPVFIGSHAVAAGVLTPRQLRSDAVVPLLHGVYRPRWVLPTHALRCAAACLLTSGEVLVTGRSAATVLDVDLARTDDEVEVVVPFGVVAPRIRGVRVRRASSPVGRGADVAGVRLVDDLRLGFDLAARHPRPRAVAYLDAAARAGLIDLPRLGSWALTSHDDDVVAVREAIARADPRAESLPESQVRVILQDAGFDVVVQYVVHGPHGRIIRADLALPVLRIAILYDGAWHALRSQLEHDRRQVRLLREAGWVGVHITAEVLASPRQVVAVVQTAVDARQAAS